MRQSKAMRAQRVALLCCVMALLYGCGAPTHEWREEVQLQDGSVLIVTRQVQYRRLHGEIFHTPRPLAFDEKLTFVDPRSGRPVTWEEHHRLAAYLGYSDGKYMIIGRIAICDYEDKGQPRWKAYGLTPAGWAEVDLPRPPTPLTPNLVLEAYRYDMAKQWSLLTIAEKKALDATARVYFQERAIDPDDPTVCP